MRMGVDQTGRDNLPCDINRLVHLPIERLPDVDDLIPLPHHHSIPQVAMPTILEGDDMRCLDLSAHARFSSALERREEVVERLGEGGMSEDGLTEGGVGEVAHHRQL